MYHTAALQTPLLPAKNAPLPLCQHSPWGICPLYFERLFHCNPPQPTVRPLQPPLLLKLPTAQHFIQTPPTVLSSLPSPSPFPSPFPRRVASSSSLHRGYFWPMMTLTNGKTKQAKKESQSPAYCFLRRQPWTPHDKGSRNPVFVTFNLFPSQDVIFSRSAISSR